MKKSTRRKSMLLALALIAALCLAGCGGGASKKDAPEEEAAGLTKIGFLHQDATWEMYQIEENAVKEQCEKAGIDLISMIAPTSMDRISMIAKEAKGFVYLVSSLGVTGTRTKIDTDIKAIVEEIRKNTDTPVVVGFGISDPQMCRKMSDLSDGAIVGSAIMKLIARYGKESPAYVGEFVKSMKSAMN